MILSSIVSFLYCCFCLSAASAKIPLLVAPLLSLPLAIVGLLDDRFSLPASSRFLVQLFTALVAVLLSPLLTPSLVLLPLLFLLVIAVTALINFTNFMDGLDGLVASCMALSLALELSAPWPVWSLIGALLGFLVWNWCPSKVFMGDVGSTFLGAVFAIFVLQASSWSQALALLLVATPLLGDACVCVLRRLLLGHPVFKPHRLHLFQRLHEAGWSHSRVANLYLVATSALAIALYFGGLFWVLCVAFTSLLIGFWLDQNVAVRFSKASSNLRP